MTLLALSNNKSRWIAMQASERAYKAILEGIFDGSYPAGQKLGEVELAERLSISRTPVREVRSWSVDQFVEIFELRALLEGRAANFAALHRTPEDCDSLYDLCERMEIAAENPDQVAAADNVATLNREFHARIMKMSDSILLGDLTKSITLFALSVQTFRNYDHKRLKQSLQQHRELTDAISAGDRNWAEAVMRAHILSATLVLARTLNRDR
ncbi:MAG: GntR family transcriptional regulator [Actinobacteria bacterium]|nr:GntR family transcriptional regulator [Actinomycetota bacterium]